jgi:hypothetical protein
MTHSLVGTFGLTPVIIIGVPAPAPLVGVKLMIYGITLNFLLLFSVPPGVVTVTKPVVAPSGTIAVRKVSDETLKFALLPLNETRVVPVNPCPII